MVFWIELTEFTELGFLVFTLCFLLNIDRAVFGSVVAYSSGSCVFAKVKNFVNFVNSV